MSAKPFPDWVLVAFGRVWVAGVGDGVGVYDPKSGRLDRTFEVPHGQCAAMDHGFGSVWTATCDQRGVDRIDPKTGKIIAHIAIDVPTDGESSIGVGEGGVWALGDDSSCSACELVRIDPDTNRISDRYSVPADGSAVRAGFGAVWITYFGSDQLVRVDPATGEVVATINMGLGPRFFDVGEAGVWVMNQIDGSVAHVDPKINEVVATIPVDSAGIEGGDLTVGAGYVWLRGTNELVAQIDPATDTVIARYGPPQGSGSASAGGGVLWISAHDVTSLYRLPLG